MMKHICGEPLKWDDKVWNLSGVSNDNMATLNNLDPNTPKKDSKPQNNTVYIPEFNRLSKNLDENKKYPLFFHVQGSAWLKQNLNNLNSGCNYKFLRKV